MKATQPSSTLKPRKLSRSSSPRRASKKAVVVAVTDAHGELLALAAWTAPR